MGFCLQAFLDCVFTPWEATLLAAHCAGEGMLLSTLFTVGVPCEIAAVVIKEEWVPIGCGTVGKILGASPLLRGGLRPRLSFLNHFS